MNEKHYKSGITSSLHLTTVAYYALADATVLVVLNYHNQSWSDNVKNL